MNYPGTPHEVRITPLAEVVTAARILVVDDDDVLRGLYEAVLNSAGFETQSAVDGVAALVLLATGGFDLVLTDCKMPRLDGLGLVRALRTAGYRLPVMMVSGSISAPGDLPADVRGEIAVALPKPVKAGQLLAGVAAALRPPSGAPGQTPPRGPYQTPAPAARMREKPPAFQLPAASVCSTRRPP
jgi:DNA-binding response OmpR family regulator